MQIMKRHFRLSIHALALACIISLWGCQTQQEDPVAECTNGEAQLLSGIADATQSYIAEAGCETCRGQLNGILGADLKGFIRGFKEGYQLPVTHETSVELTGFAAGLLSGIAASQDAAGMSPENSGTMGSHNPGNPFDRVGELHYLLMDEIYASPGTYFRADGGVEFNSYYELVFARLESEGIVHESDRSRLPRSAVETLHPSFQGNENILAFSNGLSHPQYTPTERAVFAQYFAALLSSRDANAFGVYSIGIENQVASSGLSTASKATLLGAMATARYGALYWN